MTNPDFIEKYAKPWVEGQSGNPKGRIKGALSMDAILRKALEREINVKKIIVDEALRQELGIDGRYQAAHVIAALLVKKASEGDFNYIKLAFERIDGKPVQPTQEIPPNPLEDMNAASLQELANALAPSEETPSNPSPTGIAETQTGTLPTLPETETIPQSGQTV